MDSEMIEHAREIAHAGGRTNPLVVAGRVTDTGRAVQAAILDGVADGRTVSEVADALGVSAGAVVRLRRSDPGYSDALDRAEYAASSMAVDQIRRIPYDEPDAARARLKVDSLAKWLALRWPHRYGNRLDVTVRTLDMRDALAKAQARARQVIDSTAELVDVSTDGQSGDGGGLLD